MLERETETQDPGDRERDRGGARELISVGFGPAGIALAVAMEDALEERPGSTPWDALFLDAALTSRWQGDMLLPGTDIQHHFLRDFATPRNPRSRYTFPNYLKEEGRLFDFGLVAGNPGRIEWADYCRWVADQVNDRTLFGHHVTAVEPVAAEDGTVDLLRVRARDVVAGESTEFLAENVVLCLGRRPQVPPLFEPVLGDRAFHSHGFLSKIAEIPVSENPTIAVVGSGESSIEVILHLLERYPESEIFSIQRGSGFRLRDIGAFSNKVYFPETVEYFYPLPREARMALIEEAKLTNYSAVDADVGDALYRRLYEDRIAGRNRVHMLNRSAIVDLASSDGFELQVEDLYYHTMRTVDVDAVILCTGYADEPIPSVLEPMRPHLRVADGSLSITRDYEVLTDDEVRAGLFVNGFSELTHGISDAASFSMVALKATQTLERLEQRRASLEGAPDRSAVGGLAT